MADTSVVFDIVARDRASSAMDKVRGKAALLGAAAAAMAIKFGKDSVSAFVEAEQSQTRLQAAFDKFPGLADTNIGRLNTLNASLAKKTKFDDDATASGQAVLAQFKLTGSQLEQLTPLLQDYAAKTGKDIPTAAGDLGKAMLGQGRALKAIGLDFQDTGTASGNFAELMGGLRTQVGGFAEKEGQTAAGRAEILKNQFGELQESVGSKLVPALTTMADKLLAIIGFVDRNRATIVPLVEILGGLALTVWSINKASEAWRSTTSAFNSVMGAFTARTTEAGGAAKGMGGILGSGGIWGIAIAAGIGILATFAVKHAQAKARIDEMAGSLDQSTGAITRETRATVVNNLEKGGALQAAQKLGISLRDLTQAALGNEDAQRKVNGVLADYRDQLPKATGLTGARTGANVQLSASEREVAGAVSKVSGAISNSSAEMEAARDKAARLRSALTALPGTTSVGVEIKGGQAAIAEVAQLRWQLDHIPPSVTTQVLVKSGQIPRNNATGSRDFEGGLTWVGERGPELLALPQHSQIFTASESRQMMGSPSAVSATGGGVTIQNLILPGVTDPASFVQALQDYTRRNGPIRGVSFA